MISASMNALRGVTNSATGLKSRLSSGLAGLDAGAGGGEHFAGAALSVGIKGRAQPGHHHQVLGREQLKHEVNFLDADAVLAGDAAAALEALLQNLATGGQDSAYLVGIALIEKRNRVNVAVAGVKDIADAKLIL